MVDFSLYETEGCEEYIDIYEELKELGEYD